MADDRLNGGWEDVYAALNADSTYGPEDTAGTQQYTTAAEREQAELSDFQHTDNDGDSEDVAFIGTIFRGHPRQTI